jgi:hypothetical protein
VFGLKRCRAALIITVSIIVGATLSLTPIRAGTSSFPDPYFPNPNHFETTPEYTSIGLLAGIWVSTDIINGGGTGEVFAELRYGKVTADATHSLVFNMESGENVMLSCYFPGNSALGITKFYWTARSAQQGDLSKGTTNVTRSITSIPTSTTPSQILTTSTPAPSSTLAPTSKESPIPTTTFTLTPSSTLTATQTPSVPEFPMSISLLILLIIITICVLTTINFLNKEGLNFAKPKT